MQKAIIFDMDGTLFQTELILEEALTQALDELDASGIDYVKNPVERYNEIMGVPLEEVWKILLISPTRKNIETANQIFQAALISCIGSGKGELYDDVKETFEYIRSKGYTIFIASNGDTDYLHTINHHYNLDEYIEKNYSINMIDTMSKSDLIRLIIKEEAIDPKFIVGDRLSDFLAGKENGIDVIGCEFYFSKKEELAQADYVVSSLQALQQII